MNSFEPLIIGAHQPSYLPWLGFFHKIALSDRYFIYDHVDRSRYDFTAKNFIKTNNGSLALIVPLQHSNSKILRDIKVDNSKKWQKKHFSSISQNYQNAPFYEQHSEYLMEYYATEWTYLVDMVENFMVWACKSMGINTPIERSTNLNITDKKSQGILQLCKKTNASIFIFGEIGKDYADPEIFTQNNIVPYFQKYLHPTYPQQHGEFIPNLSALDLLLNCGEDSHRYLMSGNLDKTELRLLA